MSASISYNYEGQVILITGAATGIGLATAKAFAEAGAAVVMSDNQEEVVKKEAEALAAQGHKVLGIACDVADEAQVKALIDQTISTYGKLDYAYNNAGVLYHPGAIEETSNEAYDNVINVNLRGVWNCMKHELEYMEKQGVGVIVNCGSTGSFVPAKGLSAYTASKHGVLGLTRSSAVDYIKKGIRINAVCPGMIATPMADWLTSVDRENVEKMKSQVPIGRMADPDEIAQVVLWLCNPASSYVVGHGLLADGGVTVV